MTKVPTTASVAVRERADEEIEVTEEMILGAWEAVWQRDPEFYSSDGWILSDESMRLIFVTMSKILARSQT